MRGKMCVCVLCVPGWKDKGGRCRQSCWVVAAHSGTQRHSIHQQRQHNSNNTHHHHQSGHSHSALIWKPPLPGGGEKGWGCGELMRYLLARGAPGYHDSFNSETGLRVNEERDVGGHPDKAAWTVPDCAVRLLSLPLSQGNSRPRAGILLEVVEGNPTGVGVQLLTRLPGERGEERNPLAGLKDQVGDQKAFLTAGRIDSRTPEVLTAPLCTTTQSSPACELTSHLGSLASSPTLKGHW